MATQRYTVTPHPIETLLTWVKSGEVAIPEIQRPFVWENTKIYFKDIVKQCQGGKTKYGLGHCRVEAKSTR
ncbi:MAG: hypothetical protein ACREOO_21180 [bacterium]